MHLFVPLPTHLELICLELSFYYYFFLHIYIATVTCTLAQGSLHTCTHISAHKQLHSSNINFVIQVI